ncbi:MAG: choice-of-anchor tandem repeat GloVer-containing protein [Alphaproteobacteria bacterium]|jgi:uncharacterized repeat protein (TIGR03803 family)
MRYRRELSIVQSATLAVALSVALVTGAGTAQAWTFKTLYEFTGRADGGIPGKLLRDNATGELYGTTYGGGYNCGVVYKLAPDGTQTVLHAFNGPQGVRQNPSQHAHVNVKNKGCHPVGGRLIKDDKGNLYGATSDGGDMSCDENGGKGCGVVYKLRPDGKYIVLHTFEGVGHSDHAATGLIRDDANGDLYGATYQAVFKLAADGTYTTVASLASVSELTSGPHRTLYGTTYYGGGEHCNCGSIFRISQGAGEILYSFKKRPLGHPSSLAMDESGNLYGAGIGHYDDGGSVFRFAPNNDIKWLYKFKGSGSAGPEGDLVLDPSGKIYGMTLGGEGTLFQLDPDGTKTTLHVFADPYTPWGGLITDAGGNLYGVTEGVQGTVFELVK